MMNQQVVDLIGGTGALVLGGIALVLPVDADQQVGAWVVAGVAAVIGTLLWVQACRAPRMLCLA
jgi:hypothetical protein